MEELEKLVSFRLSDFIVPFQFDYLDRAEKYEAQNGPNPSVTLKKGLMTTYYIIRDGGILGLGFVGSMYLINLLHAPLH